MAKHYIRLDSSNRVVKGFSTDFEEPLETDICITEKGGRHFELNGDVNPPLVNMDGIHIYKYIDGKVVETTEEERKTELENLHQIPKTESLEVEISNLTIALASMMGV